MEKIPSEIVVAMVKAQANVRAVGHDGKNKHHDYKYTSAEALLEAAREPLASAGLAVSQFAWEHVAPDAEHVAYLREESGKPEQVHGIETGPARLRVWYLVAHDSGASWVFAATVPVLPEKGRPIDKAEATALTYSFGYTLRGLLKIPRTDATDDDVDQRDDSAPARRAQPIKLGDCSTRAELQAWVDRNAKRLASLSDEAFETAMGPILEAAGRFEIAEAAVRGRIAQLGGAK
jgi:hypothetical protein